MKSENPEKKKSSERRAAASRANGAKSRGPVTPEGKQRSSQNARTHGLSSAKIVLSTEDRRKQRVLLAAYVERFRPRDAVELDLVEQLVAARWRLQRAWTIETAALEDEIDSQSAEIERIYETITPETRTALAFRRLANDTQSPHLLNRYEANASRQFHRALKSLREVQSKVPLPPASNPILQNEPSEAPQTSAGQDGPAATAADPQPIAGAANLNPPPAPAPETPPQPTASAPPASANHTASAPIAPPASAHASAEPAPTIPEPSSTPGPRPTRNVHPSTHTQDPAHTRTLHNAAEAAPSEHIHSPHAPRSRSLPSQPPAPPLPKQAVSLQLEPPCS
jgi:hypothetical protein